MSKFSSDPLPDESACELKREAVVTKSMNAHWLAILIEIF